MPIAAPAQIMRFDLVPAIPIKAEPVSSQRFVCIILTDDLKDAPESRKGGWMRIGKIEKDIVQWRIANVPRDYDRRLRRQRIVRQAVRDESGRRLRPQLPVESRKHRFIRHKYEHPRLRLNGL